MALADRVADAVIHWAMDEVSGSRVDSLTGNDLTDNNTVGSAAGMFSNAADFETANSEFLSIADNADVSWGDIEAMWRCWVKLESKSATMAILSQWGPSGDHGYLLFYDSGADRFKFAVDNGLGTEIATADNFGSPSTATWYLIHAWHSASGNIVGISVNAGTANTTSQSGGVTNATAALKVGCNGDTGGADGQFFDGLIDDIVLLKTNILSAAERTEDYNAGTGVAFADWAAAAGLSGYVLGGGMSGGARVFGA
jgi:hypothetical protein